jgi:hypothetical protein
MAKRDFDPAEVYGVINQVTRVRDAMRRYALDNGALFSGDDKIHFAPPSPSTDSENRLTAPRALTHISQSTAHKSYFSAAGSYSTAATSIHPPPEPPVHNFNHFVNLHPLPPPPVEAPSHHHQHYDFAPGSQGPVDDESDDATDPGTVLWCEFREMFSCRATFALGELHAWIQHHKVHHFGGRLPKRLICWWCPREFICPDPDFPAARATNFEERMRHIHRHIVDEHSYATYSNVRPDFWVVKKLYKLDMIDEMWYQHLMSYTELPEKYRHPDDRSRLRVATRGRRSEDQNGGLQYTPEDQRRHREELRERERANRHEERRRRRERERR